MESRTNNNKFLFYLIFLCLLYPLIHGLFVYTIVIFSQIVLNVESPYLNLALLAWKETALLIIFFFLLKSKFQNKYDIIILIVFFLLFLLGTVRFIKDIFIPAMLVYIVLDYRNDIKKVVIENKKYIKNFIFLICFTTILFSVLELLYRSLNNINSNTYFDFNYLLALNKIKCSKSYITSSLEMYDICIYSGIPNFYKILIEGQQFIAKNVLFMPVGDSATLSYVFLYLILILIFFKNHKLFVESKIDLILFLLMICQIYTFNRANIICTLIIYFYYCYENRNLILASPIIILFIYHFKSIFLSIFDSRIPSNIGHTESYQKLLENSNPNYFNIIDINNVLIVMLVFLAAIFLIVKTKISKKKLYVIISIFTILFIFFLNIPISIYGTNLPTPTESNYLKIIYNFGFVGTVLYIYILTELAYNINEQSFYVKILSLNLLAYQFIAPYVISGFVVFMPAILVLALFKQKIN